MRIVHLTGRTVMFVSVTLALGALLSPRAVVAAESGFKVSSYVPKYFTDFTWYVQGAGSYNWSDISLTPVHQPYTRYQSRTLDRSSGSGSASASTYLQYRYETIPRYAWLSCELGGSGSASKSTEDEKIVDTTRQVTSSQDESKGQSVYLFANPDVSLTNYMNGEFFVGADLSGSFSYQRYPKNTFTNVSTLSTFPDSASGNYYTTIRQDITTRQPEKYRAYGFTGELSLGRGHIYYGRFAATTMYLVNELRSNGFIKQEPSESQMMQLAEIIYQQRLKHYVDYRIRLIEAQQAVMNYLKSEQIATTEDPMMPLIVQDVWNYFPSYDRAFGFQFRAGVGLEYTKQSNNYAADLARSATLAQHHRDTAQALTSQSVGDTTHSVTATRYTLTLPYIFARANYQKPIDLRWQLEIWGDARLFINPNFANRFDRREAGRGWHTSDGDTTWDTLMAGDGTASEFTYKKMYSASISSQIRYIYNSRTSAALAANLGYGHFDQDLKINEISSSGAVSTTIVRKFTGPGFSNVRFALSLSTTYRISIPTTLYASVSYQTGYDPRNFITSYYRYKPQSFGISATIVHYIH